MGSKKDTAIFLDAIIELEKEKGIKREELFERLKAGLLAAYKKDFNDHENISVDITEKGVVKMYAEKTVVENIVKFYDKDLEISLDEAKEHHKRAKVGDVIKIELKADGFKRNAIQRTKSIIVQYVREKEKEEMIRQFKMVENEIVNLTVKRVEPNGNLYSDMNDLDVTILQKELLPTDDFKAGDKFSAYVRSVNVTGKYPKVDLTRCDDKYLAKLFEREVPEIKQGLVSIKGISRELGVKSKVAIYSEDKNLDIKGACIGKDSLRINNVLNELNGEKIELVEWNEDLRLFVKNALYPAELISVEIVRNDEEIIAKVEVDPDQLTLAIGKKGINTKLAGKLCKLRVNIESSVDEDGEVEAEEIQE